MPQFRTKARAVELLGKGQIADLPTAISELWKNGYDAYGNSLEAFLYAKGYKDYKEPIFVLSDDGKGMSKEDILDRWFVLGTDSKSRNEHDIKGPDTLWEEPRIKMGEKGIGRLSVAYLGPQMLMLTKKRNFPLEAVFFDWRILDNYNLFLQDINIPQKTVTPENIGIFFEELKKEFLENFPENDKVNEAAWKDQPELRQQIIQECKACSLPPYVIDEFIKSQRFNQPKSNGTIFILFQPEPQILDLFNATKKDGTRDLLDEISVNHTIATLAGLFNLFKTYNSTHKTHLWLINRDAIKYDLLDVREFFDPDDFTDADHLIEGKFDEFGTFTGKVRIYNQTVEHKFSPPRKYQATNYGPFRMKLGYVQPLADETIVNPEKKRILEGKLELYSGLFIYRDGFRVLPYGRTDADFLEFEERRSISLGDYFFSKRRMFGYLEISRNENYGLKDKSSREGFINNVAYRDFRSDLMAFFKDLAKKYFGTKAQFDYKELQQQELKKAVAAAKQEHERDKEDRKTFAASLTRLPRELESLEAELRQATELIYQWAASPSASYDEIRPLLHQIEQIKIRFSDLKLDKPARFQPTELQKKKFVNYQRQYAGFSKEMDDNAVAIAGMQDKMQLLELFTEFESKGELYKNTLASRLAEYEDRLERIFRHIKEQIEAEKQKFLREFDEKYQAIVPVKDNAKDLSRSLQLLENIFTESKDRLTGRIAPYLNHLERLSLDINEDDLVGYFKDQFEEMQKEWQQTYELAQLGIAVEIIDHQFSTLYSALSQNIQSLKRYLPEDREAINKYRLLENSFTHLEDNYKLLQPLYRTTGKIPKEVTGIELFEYLKDFFKDTLAENDIGFTITPDAEAWSVHSYESIFKPVLINIINNAIFWLQPVDVRGIKMDVRDESLLILNSGLKIDDSALEDIFKLFYSERPKGRGIGLYLAKRSLNGIGFEIRATNDAEYNVMNGACFVISPIKP